MSTTEKMVEIEFYLLGDDHTWDTDYIAIPESMLFKYRESVVPNPTPIVDWVYANAKLKHNIAMIGIYNDEPLENDDEDL
jgi:hypothetical protein